MKIAIERTELRDMIAEAYKNGYSCGYKIGKEDGVKDILKNDISEIPFESDFFCMDDALYLCTLHTGDIVICKYKNGQFLKQEGPAEVRVKDIYKWKRIK